MKNNPADLDRRGRHELIMSAVVPRPIAFVSTIGEDGVYNVAPFSAFTATSSKPVLVCLMISWNRDGREKDTIKNIQFTKDFVINVVDENLGDAMNKSSHEYASDVDEFKEVGLTPIKSDLIKSPMVAESPVSMECKLIDILKFGGIPDGTQLILGEVIQVHVKDDIWNGEYIEPSALKAIGRVGGFRSYCRTTDTFEMERP